MNNPIRITKMTIEKCISFKYPVLHIENDNGDKSYLMLFRFTHMQMCGTPSGEWSKGESTMRPVKYINCDRDYLATAICESLNSYMKTVYGGNDNPIVRYTYKGKCCRNYFNEKNDNVEVEEYFAIEDLPLISEFINWNLRLVNAYYNIA